MFICYCNVLCQVYVCWFKGGVYVGQEIIYDEIVCKDEMYGYLGGLVGFVLIWSVLDGLLVRLQLNYMVWEFGLQFIVDMFECDGCVYVVVGGSGKFSEVKMVIEDGECMLWLIWDVLSGLFMFYVKCVCLYFDFKNLWVCIEEVWDELGNQFEKIVIESVMCKIWNDQIFNFKNLEYKFQIVVWRLLWVKVLLIGGEYEMRLGEIFCCVCICQRKILIIVV